MEATCTKEGSLLGATLLIAGCCIGAGMIGLPVVSAMAGFLPTTLAMLVCYAFATGTGLLLLEATLWFDRRVNLISMAGFALGKVGQAATWLLFCFLFYCLFVAYIDGGGQLFAELFSLSRVEGILSCVAFIALIVYGGTKAVSLASRLFVCGSICAFSFLLYLGIPHIQSEKLLYVEWKYLSSTIPILLVCFGYQNLIPTLTEYVKNNVAVMRTAIFVGNLVPFLIYFSWNFVILGILPEGHTLASVASKSEMVTGLLQKTSQSGAVLFAAQMFSLFAIITPFMANTLSFVDFLKDGLNITTKRIFVYGLVLVPPTLLTLLFPNLFLTALGIAGGFADVLLLGLLPATIVWIGRYVKKVQGPFMVPRGKLFLVAIILCSLGFLCLRS